MIFLLKRQRRRQGEGREESLKTGVIAKREVVGGGSGGRGETADVCRERDVTMLLSLSASPSHYHSPPQNILFQFIILNGLPADFLLNPFIGL